MQYSTIAKAVRSWMLAFAVIAHAAYARAEAQPGGRGIVSGTDHAFSLQAAPGWVLDKEAGKNQGASVVFHPAGSNWKDSEAVMYGRSLSTQHAPTAAAMVARTLKDFRDNGNPDYRAAVQKPMRIKGLKKPATIVFYAGDQWGNYEAAAYFEERSSINALVFNCRSKACFTQHLPAFMATAASYQNRQAQVLVNKRKLDALEKQEKSQMQNPYARAYEQEYVNLNSQAMEMAVHTCLQSVPASSRSGFSFYAFVLPDGELQKPVINEGHATAQCIANYLVSLPYPEHGFAQPFLLKISMKFTD